jgi:hypothetical protein
MPKAVTRAIVDPSSISLATVFALVAEGQMLYTKYQASDKSMAAMIGLAKELLKFMDEQGITLADLVAIAETAQPLVAFFKTR